MELYRRGIISASSLIQYSVDQEMVRKQAGV